MSEPVAMITGAGGALGRATALRLALDGFVVCVSDVDRSTLDETVEVVEADGGRCIATTVDLTDETMINHWFTSTAEQVGPVNALVNNAALYPSQPFVDIPITAYDAVQAVNQRGHWLCAQAAARQMIERGSGAIVNLASITMHGGWANLSSYVATKGALTALTRALARELGPNGIRVNAVSPGAFPTAAELIYPDPEAYNAEVLSAQALKRRGTPAELAAVVSFLVGRDSSFVTGQTIEVNGGWVMA